MPACGPRSLVMSQLQTCRGAVASSSGRASLTTCGICSEHAIHCAPVASGRARIEQGGVYDAPRTVDKSLTVELLTHERLFKCAQGAWVSKAWSVGGWLWTVVTVETRSWYIQGLAGSADTNDGCKFVDGIHQNASSAAALSPSSVVTFLNLDTLFRNRNSTPNSCTADRFAAAKRLGFSCVRLNARDTIQLEN